jgi:hypothetical protein
MDGFLHFRSKSFNGVPRFRNIDDGSSRTQSSMHFHGVGHDFQHFSDTIMGGILGDII